MTLFNSKHSSTSKLPTTALKCDDQEFGGGEMCTCFDLVKPFVSFGTKSNFIHEEEVKFFYYKMGTKRILSERKRGCERSELSSLRLFPREQSEFASIFTLKESGKWFH